MEFITDFIPTGTAKSFDDLVREYKEAQNPVAVKTAAVAVPQVKVAEQDEADSSGQLDVEPLHQEGESTTMPKNGPSAKKESAEGAGASPTGADADEADSSGQLDVEPLHQDGESTTLPKNGPAGKKDASEESSIKEAGEKGSCKECNKPNFLCKCKKDDCDGDNDGSTEEEKEEKEAKTECQDCKCDPCECKATSCACASKDEELEEEKEAKKDEDVEEEKEASKEVRFVKLSNLDDKQESFMRDYWLQEFDEDFVNAMLANK